MSSGRFTRFFTNAAVVVLSAALLVFVAQRAAETAPGAAGEATDTDTAYEALLFDSSCVHTIDIQMSAGDYADLLETAAEKNKYPADVTVDGVRFTNIGVCTKGSASLLAVEKDADSNRYSLKLIFDYYDEEQTYFGLDTVHLNNNVSDASYMRDVLSYGMFRSMGVPAPLASYVSVTLNGEPYGFFVACEDVGESFLARTLSGEGELYKPDQTSETRGEILGSDLVYRGNLPLSYADIFENALTKCSAKDEKAVIKALEKLSLGNIAESVDAEAVCAYFAVNNFTLNSDSYLGTTVVHNYILYENNGLLAMLPWDYNNAYALSNSIQMGFLLKNASEEHREHYQQMLAEEQAAYPASYFINLGIDTPFAGDGDSRPMWSFIPENPEYRTLYREYTDRFISGYFESGYFEAEFSRISEMIRPYIEADATRTYTVAEVEAETEKLKTICTLRARSIRKQLDGALSCDSALQNEADWIDASCLD